MSVFEKSLVDLLPPFLHDTTKGRITEALAQFFKDKVIDYSGFYSHFSTDYVLQADIIHSVRNYMWEENGDIISGYTPGMVISNSCDISLDNLRSTNRKDAMFAPIVILDDYIQDLKDSGFGNNQIDNFLQVLRKQEHTNIFYLPHNPTSGKEYLVRLDRIYWLPVSHVEDVLKNVSQNRLTSLSIWGWYLFILKLSIHNCRTPEQIERPDPYLS